MKIKNARLTGTIMMAVGAICIILQVIANKAIEIAAKKPKEITSFDKLIQKFKVLLLGADKKIETMELMSFIGFIWLGLIGVLLFIFGFRIMREEKLELWVWLTVVGGSLFALSYLCLLFTQSSSVFSLDSGTTKTIRIIQHFWHLFASLPVLIGAYFAHRFFRKKHAVEFGEAKE